MVRKSESTANVAKKEAVFDPASLSIEQQEAVVEEYLGYNPKYFIYEGLAIRLNQGRFESDERNKAAITGDPRKWFNGWKPKLEGRESRK